MKEYEDILFLSHYEPQFHPRMSKSSRAALFAPFAALTGYSEVIQEKGRRMSQKRILTEEEQEIINHVLQEIRRKQDVSVQIEYFSKDKKKQGGTYRKYQGTIKKIDEQKKMILLESNLSISFSDLFKISIQN